MVGLQSWGIPCFLGWDILFGYPDRDWTHEITHCMLNFESWSWVWSCWISFLVSINSVSNLRSLVPYWAKKLPKVNIENEIFNHRLLTNGFELKDRLWLFVKNVKLRWRLNNHFLYLISICGRSKSFILKSMVCTRCKWVGIGGVGRRCILMPTIYTSTSNLM
jgi:hypothetical protein